MTAQQVHVLYVGHSGTPLPSSIYTLLYLEYNPKHLVPFKLGGLFFYSTGMFCGTGSTHFEWNIFHSFITCVNGFWKFGLILLDFFFKQTGKNTFPVNVIKIPSEDLVYSVWCFLPPRKYDMREKESARLCQTVWCSSELSSRDQAHLLNTISNHNLSKWIKYLRRTLSRNTVQVYSLCCILPLWRMSFGGIYLPIFPKIILVPKCVFFWTIYKTWPILVVPIGNMVLKWANP